MMLIKRQKAICVCVFTSHTVTPLVQLCSPPEKGCALVVIHLCGIQLENMFIKGFITNLVNALSQKRKSY